MPTPFANEYPTLLQHGMVGRPEAPLLRKADSKGLDPAVAPLPRCCFGQHIRQQCPSRCYNQHAYLYIPYQVCHSFPPGLAPACVKQKGILAPVTCRGSGGIHAQHAWSARMAVQKAQAGGAHSNLYWSCRMRFLDTARGCTVAVMIFVNHAGPGVQWVAHAAWDGVHLADLVMPSFLVLLGASVALSLGTTSSAARGPLLKKVLARAGVFKRPSMSSKVHMRGSKLGVIWLDQ